MSMGAPIGAASIVIGADASDFPKDVDRQTSGPIRSVGKKIGDGLATSLKASAAVAGAGVAAALGGALVLGFKRLDAIDAAKAKLTGLGHTGQDLSNIMDNALAAVKGTSFGLGDAATQAASFVAAGIKPGKDLTTTLSVLASTAAVAGTSMSDVGYQFRSVASSGKLTGDALASLSDRGIPILQFLAKQYGVSAAAAKQMVSDGKVSFADFQKALQDNLGPAALAMGQSFQGMVANTKAALGRLGAALEGPLYEAAKLVLPGVMSLLDQLTSAVKPIVEVVTPAITAMAGAIGNFLAHIDLSALAGFTGSLQGVEGVLALLAPLILGLLTGPLAGLAAKLPIIGGLFGGLTAPLGIVIGLLGVLGAVPTDTLTAGITSVLNALPGLITGVVTQLTSFVSTVLPKILTTMAANLPVLLNGVVLIAITIVQAFVQVLPLLVNAVAALFPVLATAITTAIPGIVQAFTVLIPTLIATIVGAVPLLLLAALQLFMGLVQAVGQILPPLIAAVVEIVPALLTALVGALPTLISGVLTGLLDLIPVVLSLIPMLLTAGIQLITGLLTGIVSAIPQIITAVVALIPQIITALAQAIPMVLDAGVKIILALVTGLTTAIPKILTALVSAIPLIITAVLTAIPKIIDAAVKVFTGLVTGLSTALPKILTAIVQMLPKLVNSIVSMLPGIISAAVKLLTGLVEAVPVILPKLLTAVTGAIKVLLPALIGLIPVIVEAGVQLFIALVKAIPIILPALISAVITLVPAIVSALIGLIPELIVAGGQLIDGLIQGLIAAGPAVVNSLISIAKGAVDAFKAFFGIKSPSRLMAEQGDWTMKGLAKGYERSGKIAERALLDAIPTDISTNVGMDVLGNGAPATLGEQAKAKSNVQATGVGAGLTLAPGAVQVYTLGDPEKTAQEAVNRIAEKVGL
jgi:tape measure domain-containing protein